VHESRALVNQCYRAYGLNIASNATIPGLNSQPSYIPNTEMKAKPAEPDIAVHLGVAPEWLLAARQGASYVYHQEPAEPATNDPSFLVTEFGEGEFFELAYGDGARFIVDRAGKRIWATWTTALTVEDIAIYLLGPVMGFVLRRRGNTSLHASAICLGGHAIAFSGDAQAGKSTTAAALALRGFPVLCEDIAALREDRGGFSLQPGHPRICLWPDAVRNLLGNADALPRLTPDWEKCFLALDGKQAQFAAHPQPLGIVYFFGSTDEATGPRIEELSPREALLELVQNTYMNWLLDRKQRGEEFEVLSRMVSKVPMRRIVPHSDPARIDVLCDVILANAKQVLGAGLPAPHIPQH
jgi:hypothetical protein